MESLILEVVDDGIVSIELLEPVEFEFGIAFKLDVLLEEAFWSILFEVSKGALCTTLTKCEVIVEELEKSLVLFSFK